MNSDYPNHVGLRENDFSDLVSIVMPAWKAERYIGETIESVIAQTYTNWELMVVDDCSPDDTSVIVEKYCKCDNRIKLIKNKRNGGPAYARNRALKQARGRWIAFLDSDDLWDEQKLHKQISFHKTQGSVLTYTEYRRFQENKRSGKVVSIPQSLTYFELLGNTAIATSTVMIDRNISGPLHMKNIYYDDFGCWLDLLRVGGKAFGLRMCLMEYRVLSKSVSRNKIKSSIEVWKILRETEGLSLFMTLKCFTSYAFRAVLKYAIF